LRYVSLERTKLETERGLEQLRALENKMKIDVGYVDQSPLSVDTENDLIEIKKLMERNVKN
jgi:3-deoxy-manno-octulosonate cytidylyltransferase (CMP-KDO synthetase)